jgi:hypothetical protein
MLTHILLKVVNDVKYGVKRLKNAFFILYSFMILPLFLNSLDMYFDIK